MNFENLSLILDSEILQLYGEAMAQLSKLNEMMAHLPNKHDYIKAYIAKEIQLSCSIDGIHTTLLDIFTQPLLESKLSKEIHFVINSIEALRGSLPLAKEPLPITSTLLNIHKTCIFQEDIGFRQQSIRVGTFVPPQPSDIAHLMTQFEAQITSETVALPTLIKIGLAHVQLETIHPFLEGNGHTNRLFTLLLLINNSLISEPFLYPSLYIKQFHREYYQLLNNIKTSKDLAQDLKAWTRFYLSLLIQSSMDAYKRTQAIETLITTLLAEINNNNRLSTKMRQARSSAILFLLSNPVTNISNLSNHLKTSYNTAAQIMHEFLEAAIVIQENKQKREKLFCFQPYLAILEQDYEYL